jgi:hypothetical protein
MRHRSRIALALSIQQAMDAARPRSSLPGEQVTRKVT